MPRDFAYQQFTPCGANYICWVEEQHGFYMQVPPPGTAFHSYNSTVNAWFSVFCLIFIFKSLQVSDVYVPSQNLASLLLPTIASYMYYYNYNKTTKYLLLIYNQNNYLWRAVHSVRPSLWNWSPEVSVFHEVWKGNSVRGVRKKANLNSQHHHCRPPHQKNA